MERYRGLGVDVIHGEARITSPWTVEVDGRTLTTRNIIIATGTRPALPPIPGLAESSHLTSDDLWSLRELPRRLVVLGGGPIGSEMTQAFARLGSQVTQVEMGERLLAREDAAVNALFGSFRRFRIDYSALPWTTFTDPEVARVGLNEQEALEQGIDYEVTIYDLGELDRALTERAAEGFVKVITPRGRDRVLGATIVGHNAGELVSGFTTAMRHGLGLNRLLATIHPYPTWTEANRFTAGAWKKAHAPERILRWLERYHRWRRGGTRPDPAVDTRPGVARG